jgi:hypothetical protein
MQRAEQSAFQADPNGFKSRRVYHFERECKAAGADRLSSDAYRVQLSTRSPIRASPAKPADVQAQETCVERRASSILV